MTHLHKHNKFLLLKYLKDTYDEEQLQALSCALPQGFAQMLCEQAARHKTQARLKANILNADNDDSAADEYLDNLSSHW
jgi:hypothetical protein